VTIRPLSFSKRWIWIALSVAVMVLLGANFCQRLLTAHNSKMALLASFPVLAEFPPEGASLGKGNSLISAGTAGLLSRDTLRSYTLYDWHGKRRWTAKLPTTPFNGGWPSSTLLPTNAAGLSPDGKSLAVATPSSTGVYVHSWHDGVVQGGVNIPLAPTDVQKVQPGSINISLAVIDDGQVFVSTRGIAMSMLTVVEGSRILAQGKYPSTTANAPVMRVLDGEISPQQVQVVMSDSSSFAERYAFTRKKGKLELINRLEMTTPGYNTSRTITGFSFGPAMPGTVIDQSTGKTWKILTTTGWETAAPTENGKYLLALARNTTRSPLSSKPVLSWIYPPIKTNQLQVYKKPGRLQKTITYSRERNRLSYGQGWSEWSDQGKKYLLMTAFLSPDGQELAVVVVSKQRRNEFRCMIYGL